MKNMFINFLSIFLSYLVCFTGLVMFFYFLTSEISVLSFLIGLVGYMITFRPAVDEWVKRFENIFK